MKTSHLPLALALLAVAACKDKASTSNVSNVAQSPHGGGVEHINIDESATCVACHAQVYAEWSQSMHSMAHHTKDPIYAAVRAVRMKKEGPKLAGACAQCHSPRATDDVEGTVAQLGVSCASCHAVAAVKPGLPGAKALTWTDNDALLGPHDPSNEVGAGHATGPAPSHMKDGSSLCLACHAEVKGQNGVPVCTTGPEWSDGSSDKTCVDCHMPKVAGPSGHLTSNKEHRSHRFWGPRAGWGQKDNLEFIASGLNVSGRLDKRVLRVSLQNTSQHALPSGFPGRLAMVDAVGFDADGEQIWSSQSSLLNKVYHDAKGKPVLAPYAKTLARDTRLKAGETRNITFEAPLTVQKAAVRVSMRLLPPPLAAKLKLTRSPLSGLQRVLTATITRAQ